jgi:hypothetical protein
MRKLKTTKIKVCLEIHLGTDYLIIIQKNAIVSRIVIKREENFNDKDRFN